AASWAQVGSTGIGISQHWPRCRTGSSVIVTTASYIDKCRWNPRWRGPSTSAYEAAVGPTAGGTTTYALRSGPIAGTRPLLGGCTKAIAPNGAVRSGSGTEAVGCLLGQVPRGAYHHRLPVHPLRVGHI